jgi:hypothetical protein
LRMSILFTPVDTARCPSSRFHDLVFSGT